MKRLVLAAVIGVSVLSIGRVAQGLVHDRPQTARVEVCPVRGDEVVRIVSPRVRKPFSFAAAVVLGRERKEAVAAYVHGVVLGSVESEIEPERDRAAHGIVLTIRARDRSAGRRT